MKTVVAAGLIVYRRLLTDVEYLVLQASYGIKHWTPPKGHVDLGESEMETALRETKEETGIDSSKLIIHEQFKKELFYTANGHPKRVVYWLAELKDKDTPVILSEEHCAYSWHSLLDVNKIVGYKEMKELFSEANDFVALNINKS